jgi:hypothetical protein
VFVGAASALLSTRFVNTRLLIAASLFLLLGLVPTLSFADNDPTRIRLQVSVGAVAGNNVLPAPLAPGISVLAERKHLGVEGGAQIDPITLCDKDGREGACGVLVTVDAGGRISLPLGERFVAYLSTRLQLLRMTEGHSNELGVAFRPGLAYQRERFGVFVEGGPTVLFGDTRDYPTVRPSSGVGSLARIVPMAMLGIRL